MTAAIADFSQSYYVLPQHGYEEYTGDVVGADIELMHALSRFTQQPLVKIATSHYWLKPQWGIPAQTIAVPDDIDEDLNAEVLIAKRRAARQLLDQGYVDEPHAVDEDGV